MDSSQESVNSDVGEEVEQLEVPAEVEEPELKPDVTENLVECDVSWDLKHYEPWYSNANKSPKLQGHHTWRIHTSSDDSNSFFKVKLILDKYRRAEVGVNRPFIASVVCTVFNFDVQKATKTETGKKFAIGPCVEFSWPKVDVINSANGIYDQRLKVNFKVTYPKPKEVPRKRKAPSNPEVNICKRIHYDFTAYLFSPDYSDLDLVVSQSGVIIKAHKVILRALSPVINQQLIDANNNDFGSAGGPLSLEIGGFSEDMIRKLLRWMYIGEIEVEEIRGWLEMLEIAFKYEIRELKGICEAWIKRELMVENVIEVLQKMKEGGWEAANGIVVNFIIKNKKEVIDQDGFYEFATKNSGISADIFLAAMDA